MSSVITRVLYQSNPSFWHGKVMKFLLLTSNTWNNHSYWLSKFSGWCVSHTSLWTVRRCRVRWDRWENRLLHNRHWKGFSPVWILMCWTSKAGARKLLPHRQQCLSLSGSPWPAPETMPQSHSDVSQHLHFQVVQHISSSDLKEIFLRISQFISQPWTQPPMYKACIAALTKIT